MNCIEWTGKRWPAGYGYLYVEGKITYAHRDAWITKHGPIPKGLQILHTCDNPPCVNLEHLFVGTQSDNMKDKVDKGRCPQRQKTHCPQGHELKEPNLVKQKLKFGWRSCRICQNAADRKLYHKKLQAA